MTQRSQKGIIDLVLCALLVSAQVPATLVTAASEWQTYHDPLYGYTLSIPADWHVLPTPPDVVYGAAVFANYDLESAPGAEGTDGLPSGAMRIQISVAPIAPDENTATWVSRWRASQTSDAGAPLHTYSFAHPAPLRIGAFDTYQYAITSPSEPSALSVTEFDMRLSPNQIAVAGVMVSRVDQLNQALTILARLQPDAGLVFHPQAIRLSQTWAAESFAASDEIGAGRASAPAAPLAAEYTGSEAPTSPIELHMPFLGGQRWKVGGVGSFYGNGYHLNSYSDYYATDWNRVDAGGVDLGAVLVPVAGGAVVGADAPACPTTGYGCYVRVLHAQGIRTTYAHMSGVSITTGTVTRFDPIGLVGSTGNSTGPHLHLGFQQLASGSYRSWCRNGGATCPNGEGAASAQSPKPSPMYTASGPVTLVDGGIYTSADHLPARAVFLPLVGPEFTSAHTHYYDPFDADSLANYDAVGNVVWVEGDQSVELAYAGDGSALYATWVTSQSFTLSGRFAISGSTIGPYDSVALAVRGASADAGAGADAGADAGAEYWATLAYGTDLPQANHLSIMRNDVWGDLAPIPLAPGWYIVHLDINYEQQLLRAKAWPEGGAEPGWQTSQAMDAGWTATAIGFRHFGFGAHVDDLMVTAPYEP